MASQNRVSYPLERNIVFRTVYAVRMFVFGFIIEISSQYGVVAGSFRSSHFHVHPFSKSYREEIADLLGRCWDMIGQEPASIFIGEDSFKTASLTLKGTTSWMSTA